MPPVGLRPAIRKWTWLGTHDLAATLHDNRVAPTAVEVADALAATQSPEAAGLVDGDAGLVLREDAGLKRPDTGFLRPFHQNL